MTNSIAASQSKTKAGAIWNAIAILLYLINAAIILSLPVFPSQDGPVHLYYTDIIRDLLTNSGQYGHYFAIKQLITPYAFQYYTLLVLQLVFSPEMSEKVLICLYLAAFGLSFGYLLNSVTQRNSPWILASVPFAMHSLVFMGFLNYCIAVALTMFLCGFWIRRMNRLDTPAIVGTVALYLLLMVVHPVPLAIFLSFAGLSLLVEIVAARFEGNQSWNEAIRGRWKHIALIGVLCVIGVIWVSLFRTDPSMMVVRNLAKHPQEVGLVRKFTEQVKLWPILPYTNPAYRIGPLLLVLLAVLTIAAALPTAIRKIPRAALVCLLTSMACYLLYVFAPVPLNGATFFANRFPIVWVMFLFATAAALFPQFGRRWEYAVGTVAVPIALSVLFLQWQTTSAIAARITPVLNATPMRPGSVGVIVGDSTADKFRSFDPYFWPGVHYFRRSRAVLVNAPWMYLPHIMLRPVRKAEWDYLDPHPMIEYLNEGALKQLPEPNLSFIVRDGPASDLVADVAHRWGFRAAGYENNLFEVYAKPQVLPAIAHSPTP